MKLIIEEFGHTLLVMVVQSAGFAMFLWVLGTASAF